MLLLHLLWEFTSDIYRINPDNKTRIDVVRRKLYGEPASCFMAHECSEQDGGMPPRTLSDGSPTRTRGRERHFPHDAHVRAISSAILCHTTLAALTLFTQSDEIDKHVASTF